MQLYLREAGGAWTALCTLKGHTDWVTSVAFTSSGARGFWCTLMAILDSISGALRSQTLFPGQISARGVGSPGNGTQNSHTPKSEALT